MGEPVLCYPPAPLSHTHTGVPTDPPLLSKPASAHHSFHLFCLKHFLVLCFLCRVCVRVPVSRANRSANGAFCEAARICLRTTLTSTVAERPRVGAREGMSGEAAAISPPSLGLVQTFQASSSSSFLLLPYLLLHLFFPFLTLLFFSSSFSSCKLSFSSSSSAFLHAFTCSHMRVAAAGALVLVRGPWERNRRRDSLHVRPVCVATPVLGVNLQGPGRRHLFCQDEGST